MQLFSYSFDWYRFKCCIYLQVFVTKKRSRDSKLVMSEFKGGEQNKYSRSYIVANGQEVFGGMYHCLFRDNIFVSIEIFNSVYTVICYWTTRESMSYCRFF